MAFKIFAPYGRDRMHRGGTTALAIALLAVSIAPARATSDNIFDFLFNPKSPLWAPLRQEPDQAQPTRRAPPVHKKKAMRPTTRPMKLVEKARPSGLPLASRDFMDDRSLRGGDAVMTPNGIRIFRGSRGDRHKPEDFARLGEIEGLGKHERAALAVLDRRSELAGPSTQAKQDLATGRSAAASVTAGALITDPKGRTIRYVGP